MTQTVSTELLLRVAQATPEQQSAIERFLRGGILLRTTEEKEKPAYVLRKGLGAWRLVFHGGETVLPDEKGVAYVAVLLSRPNDEMHGSELANRAFGDAVVNDQRNLALDDRDTAKAIRAARRKCQAVIDDPGASEMEREEAQSELEKIATWARKLLCGTQGNEQRQIRAIRRAIRRLLAGLWKSEDAVLRSFGEHLDQYLWRPSSRAGHGRLSRLRAGLAGRFMYEQPVGVRWG